MKVSVLYVRSDSVYNQLGVDCWDADRDARKWPGGNPIVAHPPCRAWGQLSHLAKPKPDEKQLAIHAIEMIRVWGGVLEHPRGSKLWRAQNLPMPGQIDSYGGFSILIHQSWFGHKAEKKTLLYIKGVRPSDIPPIPIRFDAIEFTVSSRIKKKSGRRLKPEITKKEREETPVALAKWLIEVAAKCYARKESDCCCQSPDTNPAGISQCCPIHNDVGAYQCRGWEVECCIKNQFVKEEG